MESLWQLYRVFCWFGFCLGFFCGVVGWLFFFGGVGGWGVVWVCFFFKFYIRKYNTHSKNIDINMLDHSREDE